MLTGGRLVWTGGTLQRLFSCLSVTSIVTYIVKTTLKDVDFSSFFSKTFKILYMEVRGLWHEVTLM